MTFPASGGPMSDEQIESAVRRAHELLSFYEKRPLDPWVNQRAPLMCDYTIALAAELVSSRAVLSRYEAALKLGRKMVRASETQVFQISAPETYWNIREQFDAAARAALEAQDA